jgi:hypothetical protein
MKRLLNGLTSAVFWVLSPIWFLLLLIFTVIAWALDISPRRDQ